MNVHEGAVSIRDKHGREIAPADPIGDEVAEGERCEDCGTLHPCDCQVVAE